MNLKEKMIFLSRNNKIGNIRLFAATDNKSTNYISDRSFELTLEGVNRKVGLSHKHRFSDNKKLSSGKVFWGTEDDTQMAYDLTLTQITRRSKVMQDGVLKVKLPARSVELSGSLM